MKRFICIVTFLCSLFAVQQIMAQPPLRRAQQEKKESQSAPELSVRAKAQYTGQVPMPEEVIWKREIYRTLNLKDEKNAALYFPVEPIGNRMNLFTFIFKLMAEGKIPAYEYRLDGTESLTAENRINFRDLLDRFHIYYEEQIEKRDTLLRIDNSDIPSSEVLSYFIKENWYFDQRSSTMNAKVVAICPVLHRTGDFSTEEVKSPMFWLDFNDISPYLSQVPVMTSDLYNTSNLNVDDYFTARMYKGEIYKTTNMLNQTLSQYCPTDSALVKEQKRIEGQLKAFNDNLWESTRIKPVEPVDSVALAKESTGKSRDKVASVGRNSKKKGTDNAAASSTSTKQEKVKKESSKASKSSSSSSGPRVSVRRQRR